MQRFCNDVECMVRGHAYGALTYCLATARRLAHGARPPNDLVLVLIDEQDRIHAINETAAHFAGREPADLIGAVLWDVMRPEAREPRRRFAQYARQRGRTVHYLDQLSGLSYWTTVQPIMGQDGTVTGVLFVGDRVPRGELARLCGGLRMPAVAPKVHMVE